MKLEEAVTEYIELKQSMGMRFHAEEVILKAFFKTVGNVDIGDVSTLAAQAYIAGNGSVTRFWYRKMEALRGFYRFAIRRSYVKCSPLPKYLPKLPKTFLPYIFSQDELKLLLNVAVVQENPRRKLQAHTFRVILLLLYGAGLRIGEALSLKVADVDFRMSLLTICQSKFYKTRMVPIGPRLTEALTNYSIERRKSGHRQNPQMPFFVTKTGETITRQMAERAFRHLRKSAGIHRHDGARYQPRLHDIRHSFAVHRLISWYRQGADVQHLLPKLATYLGHVNLAATQHYLTMTPELLHEASLRFERYARVGDNHEE